MVGALPVAEGAVMALLLRELLKMEEPGARDLGRLALVAGNRAGLRDGGDSAPTSKAVDHDWVGARGSRARVVVRDASGIAVFSIGHSRCSPPCSFASR
jgi:hypothetical protein